MQTGRDRIALREAGPSETSTERVEQMPEPSDIDVELPAVPATSPQMRAILRNYLTAIPIDERRDDVILAAGEALGNAIEHAYRGGDGVVRLTAAVAGNLLVVEIRDEGRWRLEGDAERGRGLGIMRALVDRVAIESSRQGTCVRLELALAVPQPLAP